MQRTLCGMNTEKIQCQRKNVIVMRNSDHDNNGFALWPSTSSFNADVFPER